MSEERPDVPYKPENKEQSSLQELIQKMQRAIQKLIYIQDIGEPEPEESLLRSNQDSPGSETADTAPDKADQI